MKAGRLIAMGGAALLAVGLFWVLQDRQQQQEQQQEAARKLVGAKAEEFRRITLFRRDETPHRIVLEHRPDRPGGGAKEGEFSEWWLTEPVETRAAKVSINGLLEQLAGKTYERKVTVEPEALDQYDLARPPYAVTWETAGAEVRTRFGKKTPFGGNLYARNDAWPPGEVAVLAGGFQYHLDKSVADHRERDLFWTFPTAVSAMHFVTEAASWTVTHSSTPGTARWYAGDLALDPEKVDPLVTRVENLRIRDFIADEVDGGPPAEYGFERPRARLTVFGEDGQTVSVLVGRANEEKKTYYVWVPARRQVVTISDYSYDNAFDSPSALAPEPATAEAAATASTPITGAIP